MITATSNAAEKIKQNIKKRGRGLGIKLGVKTTGCSGLAYTFEYIDIPDKTYIIYESEGIHFWIDPKHIVYLDEIVIDYVKQGLNEGFEFTNPKEKSRCGCGESFNI